MINLLQFPIQNPSDPKYNLLVTKCKEQLNHQGFVSLTNFLEPSSLDLLVSNILNLERLGVGFFSTERHNVFLEENDPLPVKEISLHPRRVQLKSSKLLINAKDLAPHASELDHLFQSSTFLNFISDILEMKLYPSTDEYGKYYANIFNERDQLNFHFDRSEFSISLILQPADEGGLFQFVPNSRAVVEGWQEMPLDKGNLQRLLDASCMSSESSMVVQEPNLVAGDLYLFRGQNSLHRVSEVRKGKRINIILTYNTEPDVVLNNYTLKKFFGVTRS